MSRDFWGHEPSPATREKPLAPPDPGSVSDAATTKGPSGAPDNGASKQLPPVPMTRQPLAARPGERTAPDVQSLRDDALEALVADGLLTINQAADFLKLSRSSVYGLMERGKLAFVTIGRSRRVPRAAVIAVAAMGLRGGWASTGGRDS